MVIRMGGAGEDGWLKRSANGGSEGLDCEFTVVDGEYAKRKIWQFMILSGTTDGHAKAAEITPRFATGHPGVGPQHQAGRRERRGGSQA